MYLELVARVIFFNKAISHQCPVFTTKTTNRTFQQITCSNILHTFFNTPKNKRFPTTYKQIRSAPAKNTCIVKNNIYFCTRVSPTRHAPSESPRA